MSSASRALLVVNVLIALVEPRHIHHETAHQSFVNHAHDVCASCPITQSGFLRILRHPSYPNNPGAPALVKSQQVAGEEHRLALNDPAIVLAILKTTT